MSVIRFDDQSVIKKYPMPRISQKPHKNQVNIWKKSLKQAKNFEAILNHAQEYR